MTTNLGLGVFFVGGVLVLFLVLWSARVRDVEQQGNLRAAFLSSLVFALFFVVFVLGVIAHWQEMSEAQLLAASVASSCFAVSAALMAARANQLCRSRH